MTKNYKTCALYASLLVVLSFFLVGVSYYIVKNFRLDNLTPTIDFSPILVQRQTSTVERVSSDSTTIHSLSNNYQRIVNAHKNKELLDRLQHLRNVHIMGGEIVSDEHAFPHSASLQLTLDRSTYHLCGASLIDHSWLVTASHCLFDDNNNLLDARRLTVVLGNANLRKCSNRVEVKRNGCIRKRISQLIPHPLYDSNVVLNDIALIELVEPIEFSTTIRPIKIPDQTPPRGTEMILAGWGSDPFDNRRTTVEMKETRFPLLGENACGNIGLTMSKARGQICAGRDGADACSGDSGGALFEEIASCEYSDEFYCHSIAGLVSYGIACSRAAQRTRGVYTSVPFFKGWIDEIVNLKVFNETDLELLRKNNDTGSAGLQTAHFNPSFLCSIVGVIILVIQFAF